MRWGACDSLCRGTGSGLGCSELLPEAQYSLAGDFSFHTKEIPF